MLTYPLKVCYKANISYKGRYLLTSEYSNGSQEQRYMDQYRAILTTTDRERISGEADVPDSKRYEAISRVRQRIKQLEHDAELLKEHHPELYDELQSSVCEE